MKRMPDTPRPQPSPPEPIREDDPLRKGRVEPEDGFKPPRPEQVPPPPPPEIPSPPIQEHG